MSDPETDPAKSHGDLRDDGEVPPFADEPKKPHLPERTYVVLFQDNQSAHANVDALMAWCSDVTSWLNFMRMALHPAYAAEMAVWLPGRPAETIRVVPFDSHVEHATYADPFGTAAQRRRAAS